MTLSADRRELIEALDRCAAACTYAAAMATEIGGLEKITAICTDTAHVTRATATLLARESEFANWMLPLAILAIEWCAEDCEYQTEQFCVECARSCRALRRVADRIADQAATQPLAAQPPAEQRVSP